MSYTIPAVDFARRTLLPAHVLTEIEQRSPGWLATQIEAVSATIDARLSKRYRVPFAGPPYPALVLNWIVDIVSFNAWLKRGASPTDEMIEAFKEKHDAAVAQMQEAADSEIGLFELPGAVGGADPGAPGGATTGVSLGGPQSYSEQSPYVASDRQRETGRREDFSRRGSGA
jgi:hypothetical protein